VVKRGKGEAEYRNNHRSGKTNEGDMGYKDGEGNDIEESEDERKRKNRGQQKMGSPEKGTRSHTARGVEGRQGRKQ
jgi:hypothetical protein